MSGERPFLLKDYAAIVDSLLAEFATGAGSGLPITDTTPGSVVRTIVEAFSRELAVAYEQLERVYKFGYLETAEGAALEQVVSLLSLERRREDYIEGTVIFERARPVDEDIPVPAGTLVSGRDVPLFETIEDSHLAVGTTSVIVAIRSVEPDEEIVPAGKLTVMPRPILGIETVRNPNELKPRRYEETDPELRARARRSLAAGQSGTAAAVEQAVRALGFDRVSVQERVPDRPGVVQVIVGDGDLGERELARVDDAVQRVRPAGIPAYVVQADIIEVRVRAALIVDEVQPAAVQEQILEEVRGKVVAYFAELSVNENVSWTRIRLLLADHGLVSDVRRMELPGGGSQSYLEPGRVVDGVFVSEAGQRSLENDDVFIGATERAGLGDSPESAVSLSIEAAVVAVWIDVQVDLKAGETAGDLEGLISERLANHLADHVIAGSRRLEYNETFDKLLTASSERDRVERLVLTVIHDRDGLVVTLDSGGQQVKLAEREEPSVRRVTIAEGSG